MVHLTNTPARIFFLHNPKAGGSSLRTLLSSLIGRGSVAPVFCNAPDDDRRNRYSIQQYSGYDFYAGHYGYDVYKQIGAGHELVTNFRDPSHRIYSLYRYWKYNVSADHLATLSGPDAEVVRLAHKHSFSDFIRIEENDLRLYIDNFHFRQLLASGWTFPSITNDAIETVKSRISLMSWFYIAEEPDQSFQRLNRKFEVPKELSLPWDNKSGGSAQDIPIKDIDFLKEINQIDTEIYDFALNIHRTTLRDVTITELS